jgi:microcystin-dependent protein
MTIQVPNWLQAGTYSAKLDRQVIAAQFDEGVLTPLSFRVLAATPSPTMNVTVTAGKAYVKGDDEPFQGNYLVLNDADAVVAWPAAPGSNSRIDLLGLRINDPNAGGNAGNSATLVVTQGTAAASPVVPSVPPSTLVLAQVLVPAGTTAISQSMLNATPRRVQAGQVCEVGVLKEYTGGPLAPSGYLWCRGGTALRSDWPELAALYEALGWPYGFGNGSTTFGIPDLGGRSPVGVGSGFPTAGASGGSASATLTTANLPAHTHPAPAHVHNTPSHQHTMSHGHTASASFDGTHMHLAGPSGYQFTIQQTLVPGMSVQTAPGPYSATNFPNVSEAGLHTHGITVNAFSGNTGFSGTLTTTQPIGDTTTGSTGSGSPVSTMGPHLVIPGWIVRAQ